MSSLDVPAPAQGSPTPEDVARDLTVAVGRLGRWLREAADTQELTPSQTSLVSRLAQGGPTSASALATAERIRPQSVAATLAVLEERGLVRRDPDPADGRRQVVRLTAAGTAFVDGHRREREASLEAAVTHLFDADERRTIAAALALLTRLERR